ncbi:hypothetical protein BLL36_09500 [Pseudomonas cedrina subsp. cedrina]|uniref:Uncharacterized protein n=1 Tax=Pseudomonas cedrina subsp. cedrina TaxID=76762 RepID=A0A1V2KC96_PSECE|nr:hypothetical protein BLL36_09500 [Pseudomonas cedrina subsp. cedrina]
MPFPVLLFFYVIFCKDLFTPSLFLIVIFVEDCPSFIDGKTAAVIEDDKLQLVSWHTCERVAAQIVYIAGCHVCTF